MLYMLKWNPFYNAIESILQIDYVYTYKHDKENKIQYKIEGYMLLAVFVIKIAKLIFKLIKQKYIKDSEPKQSEQKMELKEQNKDKK